MDAKNINYLNTHLFVNCTAGKNVPQTNDCLKRFVLKNGKILLARESFGNLILFVKLLKQMRALHLKTEIIQQLSDLCDGGTDDQRKFCIDYSPLLLRTAVDSNL